MGAKLVSKSPPSIPSHFPSSKIISKMATSYFFLLLFDLLRFRYFVCPAHDGLITDSASAFNTVFPLRLSSQNLGPPCEKSSIIGEMGPRADIMCSSVWYKHPLLPASIILPSKKIKKILNCCQRSQMRPHIKVGLRGDNLATGSSSL